MAVTAVGANPPGAGAAQTPTGNEAPENGEAFQEALSAIAMSMLMHSYSKTKEMYDELKDDE